VDRSSLISALPLVAATMLVRTNTGALAAIEFEVKIVSNNTSSTSRASNQVAGMPDSVICDGGINSCEVIDGDGFQPAVHFQLAADQVVHIEADVWNGLGCPGQPFATATGDLPLSAGDDIVFVQFMPPMPDGAAISLQWRVDGCAQTACLNYILGQTPALCPAQTTATDAGAIDDNPLPQGQKPRPKDITDLRVKTDANCSATISSVDGPGNVIKGCPADADSWEAYGDPARVYEAHVSVNGTATDIDVLWDKVSDNEAIQNGSAPYRWCSGNGKNSLPPRSPFWCKMDNEGPDRPTGNVKVPMCSVGKYFICATPVFTCNQVRYRGRLACKTVTAVAQ